MNTYTITIQLTVEAETMTEAEQDVRSFLEAALIGEPGPVKDYFVEPCEEQ